MLLKLIGTATKAHTNLFMKRNTIAIAVLEVSVHMHSCLTWLPLSLWQGKSLNWQLGISTALSVCPESRRREQNTQTHTSFQRWAPQCIQTPTGRPSVNVPQPPYRSLDWAQHTDEGSLGNMYESCNNRIKDYMQWQLKSERKACNHFPTHDNFHFTFHSSFFQFSWVSHTWEPVHYLPR